MNKTSPDVNPHLHSSSPANEIDAERATLGLAAADQVGRRDDNSSDQLLGGGGDDGSSASPTRVMLHSPTLYPSPRPSFSPNVLADDLDLDDGHSVSVNSGLSRQLDDKPQVFSARKDLDLNPTLQSTEIPLNDPLQQDPIVSERSELMGVSEIRRNSVSSAAFLAPRLYEQTEAGERSRAVDYVFELWLVIYDRIGPMKEMITTSWFTYGLERFAIRIGLESAQQANRDISEFIYENRSLPFMDLGSIAMNRGWKTSQMPDLTTYHQAIVESASFQWLIDEIQGYQGLQENIWGPLWDTPRRQLRTDMAIKLGWSLLLATKEFISIDEDGRRDSRRWLYSVSKAAHDDSGVPVELAPMIVDTDDRNLTADRHALGWEGLQTIDIDSQQILTLSATKLLFWSRMLRRDGILITKPAATLDGKTDSGYASQNADARREDRAANFSQAPESIGECSNLDAQTSYSMLAGVNPDSVQHYVSDLSDSLSSKIDKYLDSKSWPSVLRVLPGRLKAFAMQIGQEAPTQENRYIMWFIHQHHKKVVGRIKAEFSELCEPNVRELVKPSHEVMPLDEKFHRWNIQVEQSPCRREESVPNAFLAQAQQIETDASQKGIGENDTDCGSEVSGEDSEGPGPKGQPTKFTHGEQDEDIHIGQKKYEGIVLQSEAYQRLVSGLKNISGLEWEDHPEATYAGEDIQQAILRKLPTGRISSQQGPRVHVAKFWISRKETHDEIEPDEDEEDSWIDSIVVIGCGNKAQAISIKSYVFQTWPATGPAILELFQILIDRSYNKAPMPGYFSIVPELRQRFKIVLPDQTGISVTWGNMNWVITVTGLAHAVAECGQ
ncbi:hypothetical protein CKAH01_08763 [Colletotrichum kahawae]|uniref:Uncharacterized protein n=1 Tax=Colletotrichum kahawae TaxID=34407 RepID=A0AAE0CZK5_COLKA|nr:hypothetical protein CKAH01_08763 [Colletotrichum kahawae]